MMRKAVLGGQPKRPSPSDAASSGIANLTAELESHKRLEAALMESERHFRLLFEQAAVGIERADLDGKILAVNDQLCVMLGYAREDLLAKSFADITDPADLARERRKQKRLYGGKIDSYVFEKRYLRRNGTRALGTGDLLARSRR